MILLSKDYSFFEEWIYMQMLKSRFDQWLYLSPLIRNSTLSLNFVHFQPLASRQLVLLTINLFGSVQMFLSDYIT